MLGFRTKDFISLSDCLLQIVSVGAKFGRVVHISTEYHKSALIIMAQHQPKVQF